MVEEAKPEVEVEVEPEVQVVEAALVEEVKAQVEDPKQPEAKVIKVEEEKPAVTQFETKNLLIKGKGVWYPLEDDKNGEIAIIPSNDKVNIDPDEISALFRYEITDLFEEKKDKMKSSQIICDIS